MNKKELLRRYIKDKDGNKTEMKVTSVNITQDQDTFLKDQNLNLSKIVRDAIEKLRKLAS